MVPGRNLPHLLISHCIKLCHFPLKFLCLNPLEVAAVTLTRPWRSSPSWPLWPFSCGHSLIPISRSKCMLVPSAWVPCLLGWAFLSLSEDFVTVPHFWVLFLLECTLSKVAFVICFPLKEAVFVRQELLVVDHSSPDIGACICIPSRCAVL